MRARPFCSIWIFAALLLPVVVRAQSGSPAPQIPQITSPLNFSGTVGQLFNYSITATGLPTSFSASPLPNGLIIDPSTGQISGTPTQAGTFNITLSATNLTGTGTAQMTLVISPSGTITTPLPPTITSAPTAVGTVGTLFLYRVTATNNPDLFTAINLPPGLAINGATGQIGGVPSQAGVFPAQINATNDFGTDTQQFIVTISPNVAPIVVPVITSAPTATATIGVPFSFQITATGGPATFTADTLPAGLTLDPATGIISGTPTTAGTTTSNLTATTPLGIATSTLSVTVNQPGSSSSNLDTDGDGFSDEIEVALGSSPSDPTSTPQGGSSAGTVQPLTNTALSIRLNFARSDRDSITLNTTMAVPQGVNVGNQQLLLDIGGVIHTFDLNARGTDRSRNESLSLRLRRAPGNASTQTALLTAKLSNGNFASSLADEGLLNMDVRNASVTVPVTILFNSQQFRTDVTLRYSAVEGRSGRTR